MAGLWVTNANFGEMTGTIARYANARIAPHPATIDKVEVTRAFRWDDAGRYRTTVLLRPRREVKADQAERGEEGGGQAHIAHREETGR